MAEGGQVKRVPLVELPFARQCQHQSVVYHYVDEQGKAQAVALHKEEREVRVEVWQPTAFYRKLAGRAQPLSTKELEGCWQEAVLAAYDELPGHRYEPKGAKMGPVVELYVRLYGKGFYAKLERGVHTLRHVVWVDKEGRVW